jgi:hypothetical protein
LLDAVVADELAADFGEFLADEGFAAREVEVFERAEGFGEGDEFGEGEVIAAIEVAPVEAVLSLPIADRVDEEDEEGRGAGSEDRGGGEAGVAGDAFDDSHSGTVRFPTV